MKRFLLTLLLLLVASPARAEVPINVPGDADRYAFTAADTDPGPGVVRSAGGLELLLELTHRVKTRTFAGTSPAPRRPGEITSIGAQLLIAQHSSRVALAREPELLCGESPFVVYLPLHANPPPRLA